jgi:hypothetical protein
MTTNDPLNRRTAIDRSAYVASILDRIHDGHAHRPWLACAADMVAGGMATVPELMPLLAERDPSVKGASILTMVEERTRLARQEYALFKERLEYGVAERERLTREHEAEVKAGRRKKQEAPEDKYVAL